MGAEGRNNVWCGISLDHENKGFTLTIAYYTAAWVIIVVNILYYFKTKSLLIKEIGDDEELIDRYTKRLRWFPIIQAITLFPGFVNKLLYFIFDEYFLYGYVVRAVFDGLSGTFNAILYLSHPSVRISLFDCLRKTFTRGKNTINSNSYATSFISNKTDNSYMDI
jgi:hypothetical protein